MKFEGEIREIDLLRTLLELAHGGFTGAIRFERDDIIKILYLRDGSFLSASTNDRSDSLDEILLKSSKVSREHIRQALARRKEGESLGDALLGLGFITRKELAWVRRVQLVGIIRSLLGWSEGGYTLVSDYLPRRDEGTSFGVPQILVEVLVTSEDRAGADAAMEGGQALFVVPPGGRESFEQLGMNEEAERVLDSVDGSRTAAEIAGSSTLDAFSVYKLLQSFELVGVIDRVREDAAAALAAVPGDDLEWDTTGEDLDVTESFAEPGEPKGAVEPLPPLIMDAGHDFGGGGDTAGTGEDLEADEGRRPDSPAAPGRRRMLLPILIGLLLVAAAALGGWWLLSRPGTETPDSARSTAEPVSPDRAGSPGGPAETATTSPSEPGTPVAGAPGTSDDPAAPSPADPAETAETVAWTWQVGFFCERESVDRALERGGSEAWQVPVRRDGRNCYRVFWGRFSDQASARARGREIPEELQRLKPILVSPGNLAR